MKNIEKYIMLVLILIAIGAIGAAVYFGISADKDSSKKEENKQEELVDGDEIENNEFLLEKAYLFKEKVEVHEGDYWDRIVELSLEENGDFWYVECLEVCNAISGTYERDENRLILNGKYNYGSDVTCNSHNDSIIYDIQESLLVGDVKLNKVDEKELKNIESYKNSFKNISCGSDELLECSVDKLKEKEISSQKFNLIEEESLNECITYNLIDLNLKINIDKSTEDSFYYHNYKLDFGSKVINKSSWLLNIKKLNDNIVLVNRGWAGEQFDIEVYDNDGNLKYRLDWDDKIDNKKIVGDENEFNDGFMHLINFGDSIVIGKEYATNNERVSSTGIVVDDISEYCKNGEELLVVKYNLKEQNGKISLVESGYDCIR